MSKPKLLIAVPNIDGWIHKHVTMAVVRLLMDNRVESRLIMPTWKPYAHNWHRVIQDAIHRYESDYLLSMDDDNPPMNNCIDLVFLEKDIIGCPTPVWHNHNSKDGEQPYYWNAYTKFEDAYRPYAYQPGDKLVEVDATGSGCLLLSRKVMEALQYDQPFQRQWDRKGFVERGADISFCEKARAKGFKVYTHFGYPCMHFNEIELTEVISAMNKFWEKKTSTGVHGDG